MMSVRVGPLVRAVDATRAVIWAELSQPGSVMLSAAPDGKPASEASVSARTVTVGGRHFIAHRLHGLQPATWYAYRLMEANESTAGNVPIPDAQGIPAVATQCFRTMPQPEVAQELPLKVAYGSCRKLDDPQADVLTLFGSWQSATFEQREQVWPDCLLLVGDQIYADEPPPAMVAAYPQLQHGATAFEDFALLYEHAWTLNASVRQALSSVPTYMIFDDHEITNNWNIAPTWCADALQDGREQVLVDGLVAYWIYQGWGNLLPTETATNQHPLLRIIQEAQSSGGDALAELRACVKLHIYGEKELQWHYQIPTHPPIFVADARTGRTSLFTHEQEQVYAPCSIMSDSQVEAMRDWLLEHDESPALLVSSVPIVLPPVIGYAEYVAGARLWTNAPPLLRRFGLRLARLQQRLALATGFDHWPVYSTTWQVLVAALRRRRRDMIVLSGDVHFSYAALARNRALKKSPARLYQLVCTPLQNRLSRSDERKILTQARIRRLIYGGLRTEVLPLKALNEHVRIQHDLLLENALAFVTLQIHEDGGYEAEQVYMGNVNGELRPLARTVL